MAGVSSEDMDTANNNTMSNNNNSSNINNNTISNNNNSSNINNNTAAAAAANAPAAGDTPPPPPTLNPAYSSPLTNTPPAPPTNACSAVTPTTSSGSRSSRGSSGRRSHSRSRSRGHSRHRRSHSSGHSSSRHHSRHNRKSSERNFPSALCSMISIVILCTALAEPRWVAIDNGHCMLPKGRALSYLGVFQFFSVGYIVYNDPDIPNHEKVIVEYRFGSGEDDRMINCVTERAVIIFKIIIGFSFLGILTSLISFGLDLIGSSHRLPRLLRRNAIFSIFTVLVCVGVTLFLYLATVDISRVQQQVHDNAPSSSSPMATATTTVSFDVSFYLVAAAGFVSVVGVGCTCLRHVRTEPQSSSPTTARSILDDQFNQDIEQLMAVPPHGFGGHDLPPLSSSSHPPAPPPPPYTP